MLVPYSGVIYAANKKKDVHSHLRYLEDAGIFLPMVTHSVSCQFMALFSSVKLTKRLPRSRRDAACHHQPGQAVAPQLRGNSRHTQS